MTLIKESVELLNPNVADLRLQAVWLGDLGVGKHGSSRAEHFSRPTGCLG